MIVEINAIDSDAFGAVLANIDEIGLHELCNVFARWTFELTWPEIDTISPEQIDRVITAMDIGCRSYSICIDGQEYSKTADDDKDYETAADLE